jgi:hypothetical protein
MKVAKPFEIRVPGERKPIKYAVGDPVTEEICTEYGLVAKQLVSSPDGEEAVSSSGFTAKTAKRKTVKDAST